jgi:predicted nucleic acid-binding protein
MMKKIILYLDNCCFNRPYDDQEQITIYLETQAKLFIQAKIENGEYKLVWSFMLTAENEANIDSDKKNKISNWIKKSVSYIKYEKKIEDTAITVQGKTGIHSKDAIHIACAIFAGADYFITTDIKILKKTKLLDEIKIIKPIDFIESIMEDNDEN